MPGLRVQKIIKAYSYNSAVSYGECTQKQGIEPRRRIEKLRGEW